MNLDPNSIRIMTYNIKCKNEFDGINNWDNRKDFLCDMVEFHSPDVLCLQEAFKEQIDYILEQLPQYDYYGVGREDGADKGEYTPILFCKEKYKLMDKGFFWLSETPDVVGSVGWDAALTRIAAWIKLFDIKQKKYFYVFNTHFDHLGVKAREESSLLMAKKISEIANDVPALFTGDFNENPISKMYKKLIENELIDAGNYKGIKRYGGDITFNDFRAVEGFYKRLYLNDNSPFNEMETIDYIFIKNNVKVLKHGILNDNISGLYPSDHMPVVCDFLI